MPSLHSLSYRAFSYALPILRPPTWHQSSLFSYHSRAFDGRLSTVQDVMTQ